MEIRELVERAFQRDLSDPPALSDAFETLRLMEHEDFALAHKKNKEVRRLSALYSQKDRSLEMFELNKRSLRLMPRMTLTRIAGISSGTGARKTVLSAAQEEALRGGEVFAATCR